MRLYLVDYSALSESVKVTNVFKLIDGFFDVINHKKWLNQTFLQLAPRTKIFSPHFSAAEGQSLTTASINNQEKFANNSHEIFLGSIGEHITDTIKFYNVPESQSGSAMNFREI